MFGLIQEEDDGHPEGPGAKRRLGRRRYVHGRHKSVSFRLSSEEYRRVGEAGELVGLTPTGFAADATMRAAAATLRAAGQGSGRRDRDLVVPDHAMLREAVVGLMAATNAVRQTGHNLNQGVTKFHASGEAPDWLEDVALKAMATVQRLGSQANDLAKVVGRAR
ncbi:MAG: hypothetical protein WD627_00215 [Actinomycetota bacterium]